MLPESLATAIREACGEALLLDARRSMGIVPDSAQLYDTCQRLRNVGFLRCVDITALHLGGSVAQASLPASSVEKDEDGRHGGLPHWNQQNFQCYLTLRAPEHAHASLQLKWKYTQTADSLHPSLSRIWPSAGLAEREVWELLGIAFAGNDNLAPLFLEPQFAGWPLRRDYQLPRRETYAAELLRQRHESGLVSSVQSLVSGGPKQDSDSSTLDARPWTLDRSGEDGRTPSAPTSNGEVSP